MVKRLPKFPKGRPAAVALHRLFLVVGNIIRRTQSWSNVHFEFAQIGKRKAALRRLTGLKLAKKATLRYGKYNKHQSQNG